MKVILIKNIKNKGNINDVIDVSDGYAKNFLFKNNLAIPAIKNNLLKLEKKINKNNELHLEKIKKANELKIKIENINLFFYLKKYNNKISGSISILQIINKIFDDYKIKIDRKKIINFKNLKNIGINFVKIKLYNNIIATLKIFINNNDEKGNSEK